MFRIQVLIPQAAQAYIYERTWTLVAEIECDGDFKWFDKDVLRGSWLAYEAKDESIGAVSGLASYQLDRCASGLHFGQSSPVMTVTS